MMIDIISIISCMFYSLICITFASLFCLMICGPNDYKDEDANLNIMSDTYRGNHQIFTRSRKRANSN